MIEMNDATLRYDIPFNVRGIVMTIQMTMVTTPQTTEHDAPEVTARAEGVSMAINFGALYVAVLTGVECDCTREDMRAA